MKMKYRIKEVVWKHLGEDEPKIKYKYFIQRRFLYVWSNIETFVHPFGIINYLEFDTLTKASVYLEKLKELKLE